MWRKRRLDQMQQLAAEGRAAGLHDEAAEINDIDDFERPTTLVLKNTHENQGYIAQVLAVLTMWTIRCRAGLSVPRSIRS